jgi:trimethylamine--corrinoid protein Co-methyltransferase
VRFPVALVDECLALAPRGFDLGGRRPGFRVPLDGETLSVLADGGGTIVYDHRAGAHRPPTLADWQEATLLQDALDDIGLYWWPVEYPGAEASLGGRLAYWRALFSSFSKHVQDSFGDPKAAPWFLEILNVVFGGREEVRRRRPFSFLVTPASPLIIERDYTDTWLALRGWGIPVAVMPMPLMGATAPGSLLATVTLANAETIALLCRAQCAEPGTPVVYAALPAAVDPRSGRYAASAVEGSIMSAAAVEMARFYGLPAEGSGCTTDAPVPGVQAAYEKAATTLLSGLARPDILVGPGMLAGATVYSTEQLMIDLEVFRLTRRALAGIRVDDEAWLLDALAEVGHGGSFLAQRSTRRNARSGEWYLSRLGVHETLDSWAAAGRPDVVDQARRLADEVLAAHRPLALDEAVAAELDRLVERASSSA